MEPALGETWREYVVNRRQMDLAAAIEQRLGQLNNTISADSLLGKAFQIGHSYVTPTQSLEGNISRRIAGGVVMAMRAAPTACRQQNGAMATGTAAPIEQRLALMAADIRRLIPAAEVRLFGSRARGQARHDSDVDLLVTAPDAWLAQRDRFALLGELWGAVAQPDLSVDLLLHSSSEARRRAQEPGTVVHEALSHGVLLDGQP